MLQIACFTLPEEQDKANEFLAHHRPAGEISFNNSILFIGYDNGATSAALEVADLEDLLRSNRAAKLQREITLAVAQAEIVGIADRRRYRDAMVSIIV
jgi:hypothetical protein